MPSHSMLSLRYSQTAPAPPLPPHLPALVRGVPSQRKQASSHSQRERCYGCCVISRAEGDKIVDRLKDGSNVVVTPILLRL